MPPAFLPLLVGDACADPVYFFVHPLIVAHHQFENVFSDHYCFDRPNRSTETAHKAGRMNKPHRH